MGAQLFLGLILVAATLCTALRAVKLRSLLAFATVFDLIFSAVALAAFAGSFAGLIVATFAGLLMAVFLTVLRGFLSYPAVRIVKKRRGLIRWKFEVYTVAPKWTVRWPSMPRAATPA